MPCAATWRANSMPTPWEAPAIRAQGPYFSLKLSARPLWLDIIPPLGSGWAGLLRQRGGASLVPLAAPGQYSCLNYCLRQHRRQVDAVRVVGNGAAAPDLADAGGGHGIE